jgi:hypothetical protein
LKRNDLLGTEDIRLLAVTIWSVAEHFVEDAVNGGVFVEEVMGE